MLKKLISKLLFLCIFSLQVLQAMQIPQMSKFSYLNTLIQESYDQSIAVFSRLLGTAARLPKTPVAHELVQVHYIALLEAIAGRSMFGMIAVVFYDNMQAVQSIKKVLEETENGYLIAIDIHKTAQAIKNAFNITKPTIIYYHNNKEIARDINFDSNNVLQRIKNNAPFINGMEIPRFVTIKDLIQELYDQSITHFRKIGWMIKFLPKKTITNELTQIHLATLLELIWHHKDLLSDITAFAFYNNTQKIELLKNLIEQQKHVKAYIIAVDINKIDREIKDIFNITTQPTIIYYKNLGKEEARSTNFDPQDVLQCINSLN